MDFGQPEMTHSVLVSVILSTQWLIYSNSACNPIVLAVFNTNYRREFSRMLRCRANERRAVKKNEWEITEKAMEKNISLTGSRGFDSGGSTVITTAI